MPLADTRTVSGGALGWLDYEYYDSESPAVLRPESKAAFRFLIAVLHPVERKPSACVALCSTIKSKLSSSLRIQ